MISDYNAREIEIKWRKYWEDTKLYESKMDSKKPKYYCLDMFPYPSGKGLHVGHWRGYVLSDVWSRYKTLQGYNVMHPMGYDAFGLPAENDAIKKGIHPSISTKQNINNFKRQLFEIGAMYDWSREINTSEDKYYKWTQWIFLKMHEKGLAYRKEMPINWCPNCKTGLANEEVIDGKCDRCKTDIEKKPMEQWMLRITAYAERLLKGLDELQWPEKVKKMQANWIGKSEGVSISFQIDKSDKFIEVFTTRPETLYGVTYMVLAPEHELLESICTEARKEVVNSYIKEATKKSNIDRMVENKEKTGVFTGAYAINPINDERIEIWTADYVLMDYASGAVMGVPAHDERDYEFAKRFELPVRKVIEDEGNAEERLINSSSFSGLSVEVGKEELINFIERKGFGKKTINYKLRDWVFSRQRYWGEPIPIIHCEHCGEVPVREKELPVLLPEVKKYQPTGTGESPLAAMKEWVNTTCPKCGSKARRETNTMPQWAGSSWYFLRYTDPDNNEEFAAADNIKYWMPVDQYIGGIEHAVLHLLYARFYTMFLYDIGILDFEEPFTRLFNQGMINKNGEKMSKSVGNTVSPDGIVKKYGTDTLRIYELFIGPPELDSEWNDSGLEGVYRFMLKIWDICNKSIKANISKNYMLTSEIEKLVRAVDEKLQSFKLNTIISSFMTYANYATKNSPKGIDKESLLKLVNLIAPFAPHFAEEIWSRMGNRKSIFISGSWPKYDEALIIDNKIEVAIQINGKLKSTLSIHKGASKEQLKERIIQLKAVQKALEDKVIVKEIFIQDKIYNFVVK